MIRLFAAIAFVLGAMPALAAVEVQEVTSEKGITAWLVEEHSIPFTALEIRFRGGTSLDREGKRGETNLMMGLIEEGAGDLDARGFAEARDDLAASYEFDAYLDSVTISARFLTENRDAAVDLLRSALIDTRFDQDAVDRVRGQVLSIIASDATDPRSIASNTFYNMAYGDHPYGSDQNGTPESLATLTRDDMFAARDRAMALDRLYVAAVGDITPDELAVLLDRLLGDLPATGGDMPSVAVPQVDGQVHVVPYETPQSVVFFGHRGIDRNSPDFVAAYVANEILGGTRESRLMDEVREKRGLTYGIGAYLASSDFGQNILGQFSTGNATAGEAVTVVKDVWANLVEEGITAEELDAAKTYLTGAYALRFDGNGPIANILVGMQMTGLPRDYIVERNDLVNAVTLDEINRVVREIYRPEDLTFVVVGQPEGL